MIKNGAVVIDVGMHRIEAPDTISGFRLKGDVAFDDVSKKCSKITPVPGWCWPNDDCWVTYEHHEGSKKEVYN